MSQNAGIGTPETLGGLDTANGTGLEEGVRRRDFITLASLTTVGVGAAAVLVPQVDLKPKEIEMLQMSHRGFTSIEIASTMHLTKDAVSQSIFRAARKLGTSSRKSAANIAYRLGLFQ